MQYSILLTSIKIKSIETIQKNDRVIYYEIEWFIDMIRINEIKNSLKRQIKMVLLL